MKKKVVKTKAPDINHLGVLIENTNSQVGLLVEGFTLLNKKIYGIDEKLTGQINRLEKNLTNQIGEVDNRLSKQIKNLSDDTESKFETVFDYLSAIDSEIKVASLVRR